MLKQSTAESGFEHRVANEPTADPVVRRAGVHISGSVTPMPGASVNARNVGVSYGGKCVLSQVTLNIRARKVTAFVGPSGCGKTSLLKCFNRLTDMSASCGVSGDITIGGQNIRAAHVDLVHLRRRVGMIFQRPNPFAMSIYRNLELPLREHGIHRRDIPELVEEGLREVGLWDEVKDRLHQSALALSGGQQQRLCIARAVVLRPEVLLFDEPCSALDPIASATVERLISGLADRMTVVIVTHNLAQARRIADDIALFWTENTVGRLIETSTTQQFFCSPKTPVAAAYISGSAG
jgi:phosphate transport system ATP-binding protein